VYFVIGTMLGKKFLQDAGGMSSPHSAAFMLGMTATSALAALTGGVLPRLFGNRRRPCILIGSGTLLFSVALLLAGTVLHAPNWIYLIAYILLAAAGIGSPASFATMKDLGKSGSFASGISVLNALSYIGSGIIGQICGMILDLFHSSGGGMAAAGSYPPSAFIVLFVFLCALAFIFFLLTLTIVETGGTGLRPRPEGKS
jgi:MFS family permease